MAPAARADKMLAHLTETQKGSRQFRLLDAAQKAAIPGTNAFAIALRGVAGAAAFLGNTLNRALGIITTVISVLSILQLAIDGVFKLFGFENFNLLEKLVELFQKFIKFLQLAIKYLFHLL